MEEAFDVVVIGTGAAGTSAASEARAADLRVAVVDSAPFGGTCSLRGCDPKKILWGAAALADTLRDLAGAFSGTELRWPELVAFKDTVTKPHTRRLEQGFAASGIEAFHGRARFVGPNALQVGEATLRARHVVLASGAKPRRLGVAGEAHVTTSDRFMEVEELPASVVFIGGGYISFEFAHIAAAGGSSVCILERDERALIQFDQGLVEMLIKASQDRGIEVRLETPISAVERRADGRLVVRTEAEAFEADMVVHGAGRVADIEDLDAEAGGVAVGRRGIEVNKYLQSVSNPAVYAAGDAAGGIQLTPVAAMQGHIAATNIIEGNRLRFEETVIPSAVFTVPVLASVGLTEEQARRKGMAYRLKSRETSSWYNSRRIGLRHSGYKVLIDSDTDLILGAHLFGPHAEEAINVFAMAMRFGLGAERLKTMIWTYPSSSGDIRYML